MTLLNYANGFYVNSIERAGGLTLWWVLDIPITIIRHSKHFIHVAITLDCNFFCTFIHAPCNLVDRTSMLEEVRNLQSGSTDPWLLIGDFNAICYGYEKEGGNGISASSALAFRNFIVSNDLMDLGYQGEPFTWSNKRLGLNQIRERLDRGLGNSSWRTLFDKAIVHHEKMIGSDHYPLWLNPRNPNPLTPCPFRFDIRWLSLPECEEIINKHWTSGTRCNLHLSTCKEELLRWSRNINRRRNQRETQIKDRISAIQNLFRTTEIVEEEKRLKIELEDLWKEEEVGWSQRAKANWLAHGDKNTKFFHAVTAHRKQRNCISRLQDANGIWITAEPRLKGMANSFFMDLFTKREDLIDIQQLGHIPPIVSESMNEDLCGPFREEEIRDAVFSLGASQSPGPDGFNGHFYLQFWPTIGPQVCREIILFFQNGVMPDGWNDTHLLLIREWETSGQLAAATSGTKSSQKFWLLDSKNGSQSSSQKIRQPSPQEERSKITSSLSMRFSTRSRLGT
ncbi:Transposon TX1 uncharacterized 149 kDa protein [Linum perenne]